MYETVKAIKIFDMDEALRILHDMRTIDPSDHSERSFTHDEEESPKESAIRKIISRPEGSYRNQLTINPVTLSKIKNFLEESPNFEKANEVILSSASLSNFATSQLKLPPILLLGPPGVGKTRFTKRLAEEISSAYLPISVNTMTDVNDVTGSTVSWRGARSSKIVQELVNGKNASPMVVFDELDKYSPTGSEKPSRLYDILHSLFEEENAKEFVDEFTGIRFNVSNGIYIATANSTETIPESLLDRMEVIEIRQHTKDEKNQILKRIYKKILIENNNAFNEITDSQIEMISDHKLRKSQKIMKYAMGFAAQENSKTISDENIKRAIETIATKEKKSNIGFLSR